MKFRTLIFSLGLGLLAFTACSEEFLEQTPEQAISIDNAVEDLISLNAAVTGLYSNFQDANIYGWDLPLIPDLRGDNLFISRQNAGRFLNFDDYTLVEENGRVAGEWTDHYEVIVNASNVINNFPNSAFLETEQDEADQALGEAHAMRALTYWNLLRLFAPAYTNDSGASLGVPFNNAGTDGTIAEPSRETVSAGYAQVISDLETGIGLMTQTENGRFSREGAQAILAKVYLYMEDFENAEIQADAVINSGRFSLYQDSTAWFSSWGPNFGSEDILTLVNLDVDNLGVNSISGIMDQDGYGDALATQDLYDAYSPTDYRRAVMIPGDRVDGESDVFFPELKYPTGQLGQDYIKIMRLSDVYLIRAEARAENGDEDGARADLDAVASLRDPNYVPSTATGDDLIDVILDERRKELAFEGDRVYDLIRRKKTWTKTRTFETEQVSWDNPQLVNPIPRVELDVNSNMVQNAGY